MNTRVPRKRALARYLGGKNRIAHWIISFFPAGGRSARFPTTRRAARRLNACG